MREVFRLQTGAPPPVGRFLLSSAFCMLAFSVWGFVTAFGLFRLQPWSRVSMVIFGALLIVCYPVAAANTNARTALLLSPLPFLGIAWAFFFNTATVKLQFVPVDRPQDGAPRPVRHISVAMAIVLLATVVNLILTLRDSRKADTADPIGAKLIGRPAPDFRLQSLDGNVVQLSALRGKPVLLDFWATWCAPCREEMPKLEKLSREFKAKNVSILGVNVSEPRETVRSYISRNGYTYPVLLTRENDPLFAEYSIHGYPTMVTIDRNGFIESYHLGTSRDSEERLRTSINHMLAGSYVSPKLAADANVAAKPAPLNTALPAARTAEEFARRGWWRLRKRNHADALSDADAALALKPNWDPALHLRANAELDLQDFDSAIHDYSALLKQHPDWVVLRNQRGLAYLRSGRYALAIADYTLAIGRDPYVAAFYKNRATAYVALKRSKKARMDLDRAIELAPDFEAAYETRARLFDQTNDFQSELADLNTLLSLNASDEWAKQQRKTIEQRLFPPR